jgi:hypothetical protein
MRLKSHRWPTCCTDQRSPGLATRRAAALELEDAACHTGSMSWNSVWRAWSGAVLLAVAVPTAVAKATVVWPPEYERHLSIDVVVHPDGSHVDKATMSVKRLTSGTAPHRDQLAELIPLDAAYTKLATLRATIVGKAGSRRELAPEAIKTSPMIDGLMAGVDTGTLTEIRAKGLEIGDALELSATFETSARFAGQFMYRLPPQVLRGSARIAFHLPKAMRFSYEAHGIQLSVREEGANVVYEGAISAEVSFDLIASSIADDTELARLYGATLEQSGNIPSEIQTLADKITEGVADRRQQAIRLHQWVSQALALTAPYPNFQYCYPGNSGYFLADIDWGIGARVPHPLQDVIQAGKGSALDHVLVYRALLKAKGIEADVVLFNGGEDFSVPSLATLYPYTAAMVWLPEFDVYDHPSLRIAPFGALAFLDYGKPVLHVGRSGPALRRTPMLDVGQVSLSVSTSVDLASDGSYTGSSRAVASGPFVITLRDIAAAIRAEGGDTPGGVELLWLPKHAKYALGPEGAEAPTFTIAEEFSAPAFPQSKTSGNNLDPNRKFVFQAIALAGLHGLEDQSPIGGLNKSNWNRGVFIFGARVPRPGEILLATATMPPPYRYPLKAPFTCIPGRYTEDLSIHFPTDQRPGSLPEDVDISNDDIVYRAHWSSGGNSLRVHRELISKVRGPSSCGATDQQLVEDVLKRVVSDFEPPIPLEHLN